MRPVTALYRGDHTDAWHGDRHSKGIVETLMMVCGHSGDTPCFTDAKDLSPVCWCDVKGMRIILCLDMCHHPKKWQWRSMNPFVSTISCMGAVRREGTHHEA